MLSKEERELILKNVNATEYFINKQDHKGIISKLMESQNIKTIIDNCTSYENIYDSSGSIVGLTTVTDSSSIAVFTSILMNLSRDLIIDTSWFRLLDEARKYGFDTYSYYSGCELANIICLYNQLSQYTIEDRDIITSCNFEYNELSTKIRIFLNKRSHLEQTYKLLNEDIDFKPLGCSIGKIMGPPKNVLIEVESPRFQYGESLTINGIINSLLWRDQNLYIKESVFEEGVMSFKYMTRDGKEEQTMSYSDLKSKAEILLTAYKLEVEDAITELYKTVIEFKEYKYDTILLLAKKLTGNLSEEDKIQE